MDGETDARSQLRWAEMYTSRYTPSSPRPFFEFLDDGPVANAGWYDNGGFWWKPTTSAGSVAWAANGGLVTPECLSPDLLRHANIGTAGSLRGRMVRGFFWLLRAWPPKASR